MAAALPKFAPHLVISEATYGDRHHGDRKREENNLIAKISQVINDGGHVLILPLRKAGPRRCYIYCGSPV